MLWSGPSGILVQIALLNEIFYLIFQLSTLISVVPNVVMKTTELHWIPLYSVFTQRLWLSVMNLLLRGHIYVLSSVHEASVFRILGDISLFLSSPSACHPLWFVWAALTPVTLRAPRAL